jgi:hypothetical protein
MSDVTMLSQGGIQQAAGDRLDRLSGSTSLQPRHC